MPTGPSPTAVPAGGPKQPVPGESNTPAVAGELDSLRRQIDDLDTQILGLVNRRAAVAQQIGRCKSAQGMPVFAPHRENAVLARVQAENPGPLAPATIRALFRELMSGCRAIQAPIRVVFLGPDYSFSHLAALERFGQSVEFLPVANIPAVFEAVQRDQADFGVVPIENSTEGRITDTLDTFSRQPITICGEICLRIRLHLLGLGERPQIQRVCSKPQALAQCRRWLATNLPAAALVEVASTTTAVQMATSDPTTAAVASRQAGVAYGLNVLAENVEDMAHNVTRFAVIGHSVPQPTGADKTMIMFGVDHQPGALYRALGAFERHQVNISWIESFPAPRKSRDQEYIFFADLEGHQQDAIIRETLDDLRARCATLVVLGSCPRAAVSD